MLPNQVSDLNSWGTKPVVVSWYTPSKFLRRKEKEKKLENSAKDVPLRICLNFSIDFDDLSVIDLNIS